MPIRGSTPTLSLLIVVETYISTLSSILALLDADMRQYSYMPYIAHTEAGPIKLLVAFYVLTRSDAETLLVVVLLLSCGGCCWLLSFVFGGIFLSLLAAFIRKILDVIVGFSGVSRELDLLSLPTLIFRA